MTDMTDETKGDGMTLATVRERLISKANSITNNGSYADRDELIAMAGAIDAHLAAQSAMRVDEAMVERMAKARWEVSRSNPWDKVQPEVRQDEIAQMRAALQAAIGGKE